MKANVFNVNLAVDISLVKILAPSTAPSVMPTLAQYFNRFLKSGNSS